MRSLGLSVELENTKVPTIEPEDDGDELLPDDSETAAEAAE